MVSVCKSLHHVLDGHEYLDHWYPENSRKFDLTIIFLSEFFLLLWNAILPKDVNDKGSLRVIDTGFRMIFWLFDVFEHKAYSGHHDVYVLMLVQIAISKWTWYSGHPGILCLGAYI